MKITTHCGSRINTSPDSRTPQISDSRTLQIPDSRTSQILDSRNFSDFDHPEIDSRFAHRSQIRPLLFAFYQKVSMMYEIHQDFFMNVAFSRNRASFSEGNLQIYPRVWQIRRFEGVRFFPNSPTVSKIY
jgi:TFIIF-interacting CTD phosphatase-like protein